MTTNPKQIYNTLFVSNKRLKTRQTQTFNDLEEINKLHNELGQKLHKTKMRLKISLSKQKNANN